MKPILEVLIGLCQSSFLKCRRSLDNTIIIQEVIQYLKNSKRNGASFVFKIDLEKAFDELEWSFIHETLKFFKFSTNTIPILFNGSRTNFLVHLGGFDKLTRCPLISLSFVWKFCVHISHQVKLGVRDPIKIIPKAPYLSHLFYADNLNLKARAHLESVDTIGHTLKSFFLLSVSPLITSNRKSYFIILAPLRSFLLPHPL